MISEQSKKTKSSRSRKVRFADTSAAALLCDHLDELSRPADAGWEQVKHNASRTVYHRQIDDRCVYLKHYHSRTLAHRLGRLFGFSDANCEMRFSQYLSSHGVPTAQSLASGSSNGVEWLVTLAVAPARRGDEWHLEQLDRAKPGLRAIRKAIVALAELIGQMHTVGVIHCDLHAQNLLVRTDTPDPALVLMDLHRMKKRRRLSRRARVANLGQLLHDRFEWTSRTDRLRFLKHYLRISRPPGTLRGWVYMVEDFASRHRRRLYAQRDRRIFRDNQYFNHIKLPNFWSGYVVLSSKRKMAESKAAEMTFRTEDWKRVLEQPGRLLRGEGVEVIKDTPGCIIVRRNLTVGNHTVKVYIKSPRRKQPWKLLLDCFRSARPIRAFGLGHKLLTRRIATALPLATIQRRIGCFLLDSMLIVEAVDGQHLNLFLNQWLGNPSEGDAPLNYAQRRALGRDVLWQMGKLLQYLHDNNFHHRDLKGPNMIVQWSANKSPEIVLVDLDGLRPVRRLTARQQFHGLMRLNVSLLRCPGVNHAGRLRMLLGYLRRPGCGQINFKPYWRMLENWSDKKLRDQIRSRRMRQKASRSNQP